MDRIDQMNASIDYIESHLTDEIDIEQAARIAACSLYDYQRMFSFITGTSLSDYIRRRRLSLAAMELQNSNIKIIDLSLKYGYQSPDAFTRSFHKLHGITPTDARKQDVKLVLYPRIKLSTPSLSSHEISHRILQNKSFKLMVKKNILNINSASIEIAKVMEDANRNGTLEELQEYNPDMKLFCVINYNGTNSEHFIYYIGCEYCNEATIQGYEVIEISSPVWAVFEMPGLLSYAEEVVGDSSWNTYIMPPELEKSLAVFYTEWLSASGYEETGAPELQIHYFLPDGRVSRFEYLVAVKKIPC